MPPPGLDEKLKPLSPELTAERSISKSPREENAAETDAVPTETAMSGWGLTFLTVGMMTVVFLVALDHYILGTNALSSLSQITSPLINSSKSNRDTPHNNKLQQSPGCRLVQQWVLPHEHGAAACFRNHLHLFSGEAHLHHLHLHLRAWLDYLRDRTVVYGLDYWAIDYRCRWWWAIHWECGAYWICRTLETTAFVHFHRDYVGRCCICCWAPTRRRVYRLEANVAVLFLDQFA